MVTHHYVSKIIIFLNVYIIFRKGLIVGAIGEREDSRDAVVMSMKNKHHTLESLPEGSSKFILSFHMSQSLSTNAMVGCVCMQLWGRRHCGVWRS